MESKAKQNRSGERCPVSGLWKVVGPYSTSKVITKGKVFPGYGTKKVSWVLLFAC